MKRRGLVDAGAVALGAGAAATVGLGGGPAMGQAGHRVIPDVEVWTHDGQKARFYSDLVRDRVVTLNFFFTGCAETCPLVTQNLRVVQDLLGDRVGRDVFMYSVTLQPELDTVEVLREHVEQWEVGPGWTFLTGSPSEIERLRRATGFASGDPELDVILDNHIGMLRYGNDRLDRWAGCPALGRPEWIAKRIGSLASI